MGAQAEVGSGKRFYSGGWPPLRQWARGSYTYDSIQHFKLNAVSTYYEFSFCFILSLIYSRSPYASAPLLLVKVDLFFELHSVLQK